MKETPNKEPVTGTISRNTGGTTAAVSEPKSACIEANLLGRSPVSGVVDASGLAGLVRTLLLLRPVPTSNSATNQPKASNNSATQSSYLLRIGSRGLHVHSSKQRDEGFESDTDSTRSGGEERLAPSGPASPAADEASSSANSSASSDTEDPESPTVSGAFPFRQRRRRRKGDSAEETSAAGDEVDVRLRKEVGCEDELRELYAVSDVAFCHADPAFPRVAVWVVKRGQPQGTTQANGRKVVTGSAGGLEAVVFECKNEESARKLVDSYNELSLRVKLEQFKNLRRKETAGPAHSQATATLGRRPNVGASSAEGAGRYNLVQRVDGDGVTHIEVAGLTRKGAPSSSPSESEPSSIISISTPDVGDILQSQSSAVPNKSRLLREIEGVIIRSDVDQNGTAAKKEATLRQRQPAILVAAPTGTAKAGPAGKDGELRKVWRSSDASTTSKDNFSEDTPPQRPERRRYLRKTNKDGSSQDEVDRCQQFQSQHGGEKNGSLHPHGFKTGTTETAGRVLRGQYIRVSVDRPAVNIPLTQSPPNPPPPSQYNWVLVNIGDYNNNSGSPSLGSSSLGSGSSKSSSTPSVFSTSTWSGNKNRLRSVSRDRMGPLSSSTTFAQQQQWDEAARRRRSRSKSPPRTQPMAHRYIDVASTSLRLGGLSRRWGDEYGGSWGSSGTLSFVGDSDRQKLSTFGTASSTNTSSCLKSVIKKNKRFGECSEPKKVTFSAFATVQVVD
ncbi:uncharacterized protein LOC124155687 [Ischnura elegans]|uniref:uncharacterized protein LOC124155687 n=1 Tax=Ischnura elegans TaxID=197161 RepID=UPI001ED88525|nr:uncharacterized protein LOC124155687 [Ischnura elegans]XP_046385671.1 uncharacterized protein LOC124155687 [Ischnura elegans]XP_046385672.1 uncharacterized protein LOC124155687 [Ischnura elegans]